MGDHVLESFEPPLAEIEHHVREDALAHVRQLGELRKNGLAAGNCRICVCFQEPEDLVIGKLLLAAFYLFKTRAQILDLLFRVGTLEVEADA